LGLLKNQISSECEIQKVMEDGDCGKKEKINLKQP